ncbi:MAG: TauD/TfdA family dioxygenase [Thiobacillaceae bacterium]
MSVHFSLASDSAYHAWRNAKLANYPKKIDDLIVRINDLRALTAAETRALETRCTRANMVLYDAPRQSAADKSLPHQFARQLGLNRLEGNYLADEDGLSSITPASDEALGRGEYIPYTHKPINWHTDGYYNKPDRRIQGMLLHCVQDADSGGENALLDTEIAYIQLRDTNPEYIAALMQQDAMTIPARMDEDNVARAAQSGPVFSVDATEGFLYMRYTARTRSIEWKPDALTQAAIKTLAEILNDSEHVLRARLVPGMGIICNNVLHTRSAFTDRPERRRLLYRGRYYDRLNFAANTA